MCVDSSLAIYGQPSDDIGVCPTKPGVEDNGDWYPPAAKDEGFEISRLAFSPSSEDLNRRGFKRLLDHAGGARLKEEKRAGEEKKQKDSACFQKLP